jgi:integrase
MPNQRTPLTRSRIEKATVPPGAGQLMLWDSFVAGFGVRCLPGGSKTFVYRYRPHGGGRSVNPRLLKLGAFPSLSLDDARATARIHAGDVAKGKDPAQQRAEERRRSRATLKQLLAADGPYELHLKERGLVNVKPALSILRRGLTAHMATDVAVLSRNDIVTAIDALNRIGKPGAAQDLRRYTRSFLEWSVGQGLTPANVMAGLRVPGRTRQQRLRDAALKGRALDDGELIKVWQAAQAMIDRSQRGERVSGSFGALVQLALLTGMRRGELSQLQHGRHVLTGERAVADRGIDGERIHLPKAITKTAANHDTPLTLLMLAVIAGLPRTTSALLFPSRVSGGRLKGWAGLVALLQELSGVEVTLHDLRRTCRTLMSRLGVAEDIAELAIGHQRADLVARYNKDAAWQSRVAAFQKVSAHISALLAAAADDRGNVIAMHGGRRDKRGGGRVWGA